MVPQPNIIQGWLFLTSEIWQYWACLTSLSPPPPCLSLYPHKKDFLGLVPIGHERIFFACFILFFCPQVTAVLWWPHRVSKTGDIQRWFDIPCLCITALAFFWRSPIRFLTRNSFAYLLRFENIRFENIRLAWAFQVRELNLLYKDLVSTDGQGPVWGVRYEASGRAD